jgi:hypothetical protein
LKPVTGWQIQPGILHAPGSLVTYQPQGNPDVFAVYQSMAAGRAVHGLAAAYRKTADSLRPWTIDFGVAQNYVAARRERRAAAPPEAHVLGWLHVPERRDARSEDLERRARRNGSGAQCVLMELM